MDPICSTHNYPKSPSVLTNIDMLAFQSEGVTSSDTNSDIISDDGSVLSGRAGMTSTTVRADNVQAAAADSTANTDTEQEPAAAQPTNIMSPPAQATPAIGAGLGYLSEILAPSEADGSAVDPEMSLLDLSMSGFDAALDLPTNTSIANHEGQYVMNASVDAFDKANVSTSGYVRIAVKDI